MDGHQILKALSNQTRVEILRWLKRPKEHFQAQEQPLEMGVSASQFERSGLSQSTVSSHLGVLQRAGLVSTRRVGQWVFYSRNDQTIREFLAFLNKEL
ncbi:putative transcriptional regulator [Rhizobium leguminosarum bv. trifolii WSM2297]|uniref:Putative transcriptional regulator n=1 Tax=Rhizobium leguminosarum bv. trifolii WSM2297 TaxID=754762 RepID=J0KRU1_RHILT|nr:metalloregulator ArsR/SmtB family transcription factor [Rhizobium leguminosarum]EJC80214.1 putative transcriptional regulator [Rhizobium leguminosarum bv. trifolii WSM2297]